MKVDYKTPLQVTVRSLWHYHRIEAQVEETRSTDFFPEAEFSGDAGTFLRFNPKVQTVFALYNLAMSNGCDTGEAVVRYVLFHAALETDNCPPTGYRLTASTASCGQTRHWWKKSSVTVRLG